MKKPEGKGPFYFTFKWKDEEGRERESQYSGFLTKAEASQMKRAQQAFNSRDKRVAKTYYDFSPIMSAS
jgi:hypothetical protein